jgi:hypothetical protein
MVTSKEEITRRIEERDSERSARRAHAATIVGQMARRHAELAGQITELERELGTVLTEAGDVIDAAELAQVTDIPIADLTRWVDHATKPARSGKRTRPRVKTHRVGGHESQAVTEPPAARTATPAPVEPAAAPAGAATS